MDMAKAACKILDFMHGPLCLTRKSTRRQIDASRENLRILRVLLEGMGKRDQLLLQPENLAS
jgi:hypothetical protein